MLFSSVTSLSGHTVEARSGSGQLVASAETQADSTDNKIARSKDFSWGTMAINVRNSIESVRTDVGIGMAVLDNKGKTLCNATLELEVTDPDGNTQLFSTQSTTIKPNSQCADQSVTNEFDYAAIYKTSGPGTYRMRLVAKTDRGTETITDSFEVREVVDYTVERTSFPTRIYPYAEYPVQFTVHANKDYQGVLRETVPANFDISHVSDDGVVEVLDDRKIIAWNVQWKAGESHALGYTIDFPKVSPELYLLGPVTIGDYTEARPWQVASDGLTQTWTGDVNGNWSNPGNWSSGTIPNAYDDLVFPASVTTYSTNNDFPQYTAFNSITISGSGYTLAGNDIILGQGGAGITDSATSGGNTISLPIRMDVTRWITVVYSNETLTVSGKITGLGGLNKKGIGKLVFSGANTYAGITTIDEGVLNARNDRALGTIANGTVVVGGAALELQGGITIGREPLTLRGYGVSDTGALRNISGTNTFQGLITLGINAEITSDADLLKLRGGITGTIPLVLDGAGNIAFYDAPIAISTGTIDKNGSGTVTYFFPNTYTGLTSINAGKLLYGVNDALSSGAITVNGGTLDIDTFSDMVGTVTLGTLTGATGEITGATGMLSSGAWTVYAGTISAIIAGDAGAVTKSTPATVTLSRPNQYTGAVSVNAGILKITDSMALGTIDGATTVAAGATLQIDGDSLSIPEYITLNGSGMLFAGALKNSSGDNTITGLITLGSISYIESDVGTTLTIDTKGLAAVSYPLHLGGVGNITFTSTAPIYGTSATLTKNDAGTVTLGAFNNITGTTTINNGTLILSGLGAIPMSTTMVINSQATLTIDNSNSTTDIDRLADTLALTMNGGNFNISGSANRSVYASAGALTFGTGNNILTVTPGSGGSTTLRFASYARTAGASVLFRGVSFGSTPGPNVSTLLFTTAPTLAGDDGESGTPTLSILQGAFGDNSTTGTGTDMVTYGRGNLNGLRLLNGAGFSNEYTTDFTITNANIKIASSTVAVTSQINSLVLNTGASITDAGGSRTITLISGNILNLQNNATIAGANTTIAGGAVELAVRTVDNLDISCAITTSGGLTKSGNDTLTYSTTTKAYTGLTSINQGTLLFGLNDVISSGIGNVTVNNATLNIANYNNAVGAVILQSGTITSGTTGTLTATSYDLRSGTVSAILAGSGTLTKSVTNTQADATVILTRDNTYTGVTAISAGILKLGATGDGTNTPLGTTAAGTTIANIGTLDLNGFDLSIAEAITSLNGLGVGVAASVANGNSNMGAIMNSSLSSATYSGAVALGAAARINADFGTVTIGTGAVSGAFALTVGGYGTMTISSPIGNVSGLTKDGLGTVTLSGNSTCASAFTVSTGILKLGAAGDGTNGPLGTAVGATTISAGAIFDLNGQTYTTAEPLTMNGIGGGVGIFAEGAFVNSSASSATFPGNITLGAASTIRADFGSIVLSGTAGSGAQALTLLGSNTSSSLAGTLPSGAGTIAKYGSGTWTLSGNSTFTSTTVVYNGTLKLGGAGSGVNSPLGTTGGATTVYGGGVLDLNGYTLITAEPLTLHGFGINAGGALINYSGSGITYSGAITQGTDSRITNSGAGLLTLTGGVSGAFALYVGGPGNITFNTGLVAVGAGTVNKEGDGTVTINSSASYTGATYINAGTFAYGASGLLAATNVVVRGGTWDMGGITDTVGTITLISGTIQNGTLTGVTQYTVESGAISVGLGATAVPMVKNTAGTVTLSGAAGHTSATTINAGTLVLNGNGTAVSSAVTINYGGTLTLDNSGTNIASRLGDALVVTMNGGNFNLIGKDSTTVTETIGQLAFTSGHNVVTIDPKAGSGAVVGTTLTVANNPGYNRTAGATVLFRGLNFGSTPAAGVSSIKFTTAPTAVMFGGSGSAGSTTVNVLKGAFGDNSLTGNGTDMVTYNVGNSTGLRLLNGAGYSGEYAGDLNTANANVKLTANTAATSNNTNSLILNGYNVDNASVTLPIAGAALAGNMLIDTANTIAGANTVLGITTYELCILAKANSTISATIGTAAAGSVTVSGSANVTLSATNAYTSTTFVNGATLTYGATNALSSGGVTIVGGTYDLNIYSDTIGALSMNAGTVQTSDGTLTLGGTVTTIANNYESSIISGKLGLGGNRDFNVGNGDIENDLIVSAVVSGGFTVSKITGVGVMVLSGNNTYTGTTTISAGILRLGSAGTSPNTPLGTTAGTTTVGTSSTLDLNGYSLDTAEAINISGTGATALAGAIANSSSITATYSGQITLGAAVSVYANFGNINLTSTDTVAGAFALTLRGNGDGTFAGTLGNVASSIIKNDLGTWTVSGNSAYTGVTTITLGVFKLGSAGSGSNTPLGTTGSATTVASGGVLDMNGYTLVTAEPLSINGTGIANCGAVYSNSTSPTNVSYSGAITLGGTVRVVNLGSGTLTLSGAISGNQALTTVNAPGTITLGTGVWSGSGTLTKEGWGTTILSGQNSMTGAMTITTGYLQLGADGEATNSPLGTIATGLTVSAGAVFDLSTYALGTLEPIASLNGTGINNGGAIIGSASTPDNTSFGAMTVSSNSRVVNSGTGTITFAGTVTSANNRNLAIGGTGPVTISGNYGGATSATLTKWDSGLLIVSGATNPYTGLTRINGGTLKYGATNAINTGAVTIAGGTLDFNGYTDTVGIVTLISGTLTDSNVTPGVLTVATNSIFESGAVSGVLAGTTLAIAKNTGGTVTFSNNGTNVNTYTGTTSINAGTLQYLASNIMANVSNITVIGGILDIGAYSDTIGTLTLTSGSVIGSTGILTGASYAVASGQISAILAGAGNLTKTGTGTVSLSGTNTYTGITTVSAGVLSVGTIGNGGDSGNLGAADNTAGKIVFNTGTTTLRYTGATAGTDRNYTTTNTFTVNIDVTNPSADLTFSGAGTATSAPITKIGQGDLIFAVAQGHTGITSVLGGTLKYGVANALSTGGVTVNNGVFDINNFSDSVGAVILLNGGKIIDSAGTSAVLTSTTTFNLQSGTISAKLAESAVASAISKTTSGRVIISGANSFTNASPTIAISAGVLNVRNNLAFGGAAPTVSNLAALEIQGAITIPSTKTIAILGSGVNNGGAIRNISGSNTIQAVVSLGAIDNRINSDSDTLTLSGNITGNNNFIVGGAGDTTISGNIQIISSTVTKDGSGTLLLTGSTNNYSGSTTVSAGTLQAGVANPFVSATTSISSGGTLDLAGYNLTSAGSTSFQNSGTIRLYGGETVTNAPTNNTDSLVQYYGIAGPYTIKNWTYDSLQLSSTSTTTHNLPATITVNKDITIDTNNTLNTTGSNHNINIVGDWTNNGAYTGNASKVTFNNTNVGSTQTILGTNTFYDLEATSSVARTIKFPSSTTTTITNSLTLTGTTGPTYLTLAPSTASTTWTIDPPLTQTLNYVSVSYSTAVECITATNSYDGLNNNLWNFSGLCNSAPNAPQTPYVNNTSAQTGQTNPTKLIDHTPAFSAIFDDDNTSDTSSNYEIEVGDDNNWVDGAEMWDTGKTAQTSCSENARCADKTYAGTTLVDGTTYYWRIRFWDNSDLDGSWSTTQNFTMNNAPSSSSVSVNGGVDIDLTSSPKSVSWTATLTDLDGNADIASALGRIYRSGVSSAEACTLNDNNCYEDASCSLSNCSGNTCDATCTVNVLFHADPTDAGSLQPTEYWRGWIRVDDDQGENGSEFSAAGSPDMGSLLAIDVNATVTYGMLMAGEDSQSDNETTVITNSGNRILDIEISGDNLCTDYPTCSGYTISAGNQEYSLSNFTYGSGTDLPVSPPNAVNINISKPTTSPSDSTKNLYWGIAIPNNKETGAYAGANSIIATDDQ